MTDASPPIFTGDAAQFTGEGHFSHRGNFAQIIFGTGCAAELATHIAGFGARRPALLATPGRRAEAERIARTLTSPFAGVFAAAIMHSPVDVSDATANDVRAAGADLLVSIGGGSAIGLGKAVSLRTGLKHITLPTTYSGSELTPILGETESGAKRTIRDDRLRPAVVLYDPALTYAVPRQASMASGMNALAHAIEASYMSEDPEVLNAAAAAIGHLQEALPRIYAASSDPVARSRALYGAWLAGFCLAETPMALHHKLCHTLGGAYDLPHAETHAVLLPHSLAYNAPAVPRAYARLSQALINVRPDPAHALHALSAGLGLPTSLRALGFPQDGIDRVSRLACENAYTNPRALEPKAIGRLLTRAWIGALPDLEAHSHA